MSGTLVTCVLCGQPAIEYEHILGVTLVACPCVGNSVVAVTGIRPAPKWTRELPPDTSVEEVLADLAPRDLRGKETR